MITDHSSELSVILQPGPSSESNSTSPLDLQQMSLSPAPRHNIADEEIDEMHHFLSDNPNVSSSDGALLFSTKFRKEITPELIDHLRNRRQQQQQQQQTSRECSFWFSVSLSVQSLENPVYE